MSRRIVGRPVESICFLCSNKVKKHNKNYLIPVDWVQVNKDIPIIKFYENLIVHRSCYKETSKKQLEKALKLHIKSLL